MSRKGDRFGKLQTYIVEPPHIITTCTTENFCLESFHNDLHLPTPLPAYKISQATKWYTGVPLYVVVIAYNKVYQQFRESRIFGSVMLGSASIANFSSQQDVVVEPYNMSAISHQTEISFPGKITLASYINFKYENAKLKIKSKLELEIVPSLQFTYVRQPGLHPIFSFSVTNKFQDVLMKNVEIRTSSGESVKICNTLGFDQSAGGYLLYKTAFSFVEIYFTLPFSIRCNLKEKANGIIDEIQNNAKITIGSIPRAIQMLKPFPVMMTIENLTFSSLSGNIYIEDENNAIFYFGNNNLVIPEITIGQKVDIPLELIALKQGNFQFPKVVMKAKGYSPFEFSIDKGIIVIGNDQ